MGYGICGPRRFSFSLLVMSALIAGCSATTLSSPSSGAHPSVPTSTRAVPAVPRPLDVADLAARPCDLLSSADARELGLESPGRPRQVFGALECRWARGGPRDLSLVLDADRDLLADAYRAPWRGVSVESVVYGYPALRRKTGRGEFNSCTVITRLGPRQALTADWVAQGTPTPGNDACEFAEQATALVVRKLPPAR